MSQILALKMLTFPHLWRAEYNIKDRPPFISTPPCIQPLRFSILRAKEISFSFVKDEKAIDYKDDKKNLTEVIKQPENLARQKSSNSSASSSSGCWSDKNCIDWRGGCAVAPISTLPFFWRATARQAEVNLPRSQIGGNLAW